MDLLNNDIRKFTFEDISDFCQEGHREGIQLDYKKELPKNIDKHFASFSNTRGGVIIIGVEEDAATGVPKAWEGISSIAKVIEIIHQNASNVDPIPSYDVCATNDKDCKSFVMIRIFEGDRPPYYVQNNPNLYVRTGNVTKSIDIAQPEQVKILLNKANEARIARENSISMAEKAYDHALKRAEFERNARIAKARTRDHYNSADYFQQELGTSTSILSICVQPYYPRKGLITPREIWDKISEIKCVNKNTEFPCSNPDTTIPNGLVRLDWRQDNGYVGFEEITSNGLLLMKCDVLRLGEDGVSKYTHMYKFALNLGTLLMAARNFYNLVGYRGGITGFMNLKNAEEILAYALSTTGYSLPKPRSAPQRATLLDYYHWDFELDTSILNDPNSFLDWFHAFFSDVYWSFGFLDLDKEVLKIFLKEELRMNFND